jgi:hypothetical protein
MLADTDKSSAKDTNSYLKIQSTSVSVKTASQYTQQSGGDIPETSANDAVAKAMEVRIPTALISYNADFHSLQTNR